MVEDGWGQCRACRQAALALYPLTLAGPGRTHKIDRFWDEHSGVARCLFRFGGFFNLHIAELVGVEDLATFQALDELRVFVPGDDADFGMFADGWHLFAIG